jgi:hypothetical protein
MRILASFGLWDAERSTLAYRIPVAELPAAVPILPAKGSSKKPNMKNPDPIAFLRIACEKPGDHKAESSRLGVPMPRIHRGIFHLGRFVLLEINGVSYPQQRI